MVQERPAHGRSPGNLCHHRVGVRPRQRAVGSAAECERSHAGPGQTQSLQSSCNPTWPDDLGVDQMPKYVKRPADLTDGHLLELARVNDAQLVTLDGKIPEALLIP